MLRFMLFSLCGKYSDIVSLHFFERSGIVPTCVADSIIAVWTESLSATKIVWETHVSAKCEHVLKLQPRGFPLIEKRCAGDEVAKALLDQVI